MAALSLIILGVNLKKALGMIAGRTYLRRTDADYNVAAIPAFPDLDLALFKYLGRFYVFKQCTVALFMVLFNFAYQTEALCKLGKAFLIGCFGKALVHVGPFVVLAVGRSC